MWCRLWLRERQGRDHVEGLELMETSRGFLRRSHGPHLKAQRVPTSHSHDARAWGLPGCLQVGAHPFCITTPLPLSRERAAREGLGEQRALGAERFG